LLLLVEPVEDRVKAEVPEEEKVDQVDRGVKVPNEVRKVPVEGEVKVIIDKPSTVCTFDVGLDRVVLLVSASVVLTSCSFSDDVSISHSRFSPLTREDRTM
jgi:hypothetical protein